MSAEAQIKSFVDRVLRLKEEQDTIGQDIRDIYAEAKSLGFDKTQLGNVVSHVRKVEKKGRDAINEGNAIFDMYLAAYEGTGTPVATRAHTHEAEPHDPETGEILESGSHVPAASSSRLTDAAPDESSVANHAGPQFPAVPGGEPSTPSPDADGGAKMDGDCSRDPGQPGDEPECHYVQSGQAANNSEPVKRGHPLRPLCRYPGEDRCAGYGSVTCHACLRAAREDEVAA